MKEFALEEKKYPHEYGETITRLDRDSHQPPHGKQNILGGLSDDGRDGMVS